MFIRFCRIRRSSRRMGEDAAASTIEEVDETSTSAIVSQAPSSSDDSVILINFTVIEDVNIPAPSEFVENNHIFDEIEDTRVDEDALVLSDDVKRKLFDACQNGSYTTVRQICGATMKKGWEEVRDENNKTLLISAIAKGHTKVVEVLLTFGADANSGQHDDDGLWSPLLAAARSGHHEIIDLLLATKGIQVDKPNHRGWSPLTMACYCGRLDIVKKLVACGADINIKDTENRTLLMIACVQGSLEVAQYLIESKVSDVNGHSLDTLTTPLIYAVLSGKCELVSLLLDHGADVEMKDNDGFTPLITACDHNDTHMVNLLVSRGANIEARDNELTTPLIRAAFRGHELCVLEMIKLGGDVNAIDKYRWDSLLWAAREGHTGVVKTLLSHGAVPCVDLVQRTILMWACREGHIDVVIAILEHEKYQHSLETRDKMGMTALMWAVRYDRLEVVKTLVKFGVNMETVDDCGNNCVMLAVLNNHDVMLKHLLEEGVDIDVVNCNGLTLLHAALVWPETILPLPGDFETDSLETKKMSIIESLLAYGCLWHDEDVLLNQKLKLYSETFQHAIKIIIQDSYPLMK